MYVTLAAMCLLLVMLIWLICGGRELLRRQNDYALADKQLALYRLLYARARDGPEAQRTLEQLELSRIICQNIAAEYNQCLANPLHRMVARALHCPSILLEQTKQEPEQSSNQHDRRDET